MVNKLGENFTKQLKLNLLPGISLPRGIYQMEIQYVTDTGGNVTIHHMFQSMMRELKNEYDVIVGQDVRSVDVRIFCHNSFPTNPLISYRYQMRIDRLILLNLAVRLLDIK